MAAGLGVTGAGGAAGLGVTGAGVPESIAGALGEGVPVPDADGAVSEEEDGTSEPLVAAGTAVVGAGLGASVRGASGVAVGAAPSGADWLVTAGASEAAPAAPAPPVASWSIRTAPPSPAA